MSSITPCLWFDTEAEEAAAFYSSVFPRSRVVGVSRYDEAGPREPGMVMVVTFELDGRSFMALNGGPQFPFTEAISFQVDCASEEEVDFYWSRLGEGGQEGRCGWLEDRYGVSWQIVPTRLKELLGGPDPQASRRVMEAMLTMGKIDVHALERAAAAPAPEADRPAARGPG